ncbi:ribonuclease H-like domain-containing protein [Ilyonectria destructans]|nr:ribonuclease H-like domain-containing protein [Ilyonectria destructans]
MNKRRAGAGATPASTGSSKKRKVDNVQKFYAVKAGFHPGVYLTYAECQLQTAGFKGAVFKSFTSQEDADNFVAGKKVKSSSNEPDKFYAVAVGSPTGIYTDWTEASEAIKGVKGPKYKRFATRAEAVAYIRQFGNRDAIEALGEEAVEPEQAPAKKAKPTPKEDPVPTGPQEDILKVYTDGSSLANGKKGSRAGLGVFFGNGDPRNLSEKLPGELQTNQRAELMAMLRALEIAPLDQAVQIFSDSQYSINCVTQWALSWERKGWKTATGEDVKNQDIIRDVLAKMAQRTKAGSNTYFQWVKGHASDRGNIAADRLAVLGARM